MLKYREKAKCWDTLLMTAVLWGKVESNLVIPGSMWATLKCGTQDSEVCIITPRGGALSSHLSSVELFRPAVHVFVGRF